MVSQMSRLCEGVSLMVRNDFFSSQWVILTFVSLSKLSKRTKLITKKLKGVKCHITQSHAFMPFLFLFLCYFFFLNYLWSEDTFITGILKESF